MASIPMATRRHKRSAGANHVTTHHYALHEEYAADELEFLKAMDLYKREHKRPFPTWREVLDVLKALGYRKT